MDVTVCSNYIVLVVYHLGSYTPGLVSVEVHAPFRLRVCICLQVASGLAYLHEHNIVYYDLKSPNILVFQFPNTHDSLLATQGQGFTDQCTTPSAKNSDSPGMCVCSAVCELVRHCIRPC